MSLQNGHYTGQGDLFLHAHHETVKLQGSEKTEATQKAIKQDEIVLSVFKQHPTTAFAWFEIWPQAQTLIEIGEVSLKRALTNLKVRGELVRIKTMRVLSPSGGICNKYALADKINQMDYQPISHDS